MEKFNFIEDEAPTLTKKEQKLSSIVKLTPRKLANQILEAYDELGGTQWLVAQGKADPKAFFELLKKILPTNIKLDGMESMSINLIAAYLAPSQQVAHQLNNADVVDLEDRRRGLTLMSANGEDKDDIKKLASFDTSQIATGGNQHASETPPSFVDTPSELGTDGTASNEIEVTDRYSSDDLESTPDDVDPATATSGSPLELGFDFE